MKKELKTYEQILEEVSGVKYTFDILRLFTEVQVMEAMRLWGEQVASSDYIEKGKINLSLLPQMSECSDVADACFTVPYEELGLSQIEWEGISNGWQKAVEKMNKVIVKENGNG